MNELTVAETADAIRTHHKKLRSWLERSPDVEIGQKPAGRIFFSLKEAVVLAIARELIDAGYKPQRALQSALIVVEACKNRPYSVVAAFPLIGDYGQIRIASYDTVLKGALGTKIVVDISGIWADVAKKFAGYARRANRHRRLRDAAQTTPHNSTTPRLAGCGRAISHTQKQLNGLPHDTNQYCRSDYQ